MSNAAYLFLALRVPVGFFAAISLGITTAFLLEKPVTFFELGLISALLLTVSSVMEYPGGNLADRYGRKRIFALGVFAMAVNYAFLAAFANIILLSIAAVFSGLGEALISGSLEAWVGEEEKRKTPDPSLHRVFGLKTSLISISAFAVSLNIGLLLRADLELIFWAGAALFTGIGLTALIIGPDNRGEGKGTLGFTIAALRGFARSPALIFLTAILSATFACFSVFILYWQPRALTFGVPADQLLSLHSAYLAGAAISSYLYARLARKLGSLYFVHASFVSIALSFALMAFGNCLVTLVAGLFVFGLGWGSVFPTFFDWGTDIIPSDLRASVLSLMSAIATAVAILATAMIGTVIHIWGLETAVHSGLGLAVGILMLLGLVGKLTSAWQAQRSQNRHS